MTKSSRRYFDWNATAPLREEARAAMVAALERGGNASSVHAEGRAARAVVEKARADVAALVNVEPKQVIFTSGGTEANALALTPFIETGGDKAPRDALLISAVEHPSVRSGGSFDKVTEVAVTADGRLDLDALKTALANSRRPLVSIMFANNETGAVQPVAEAAALVHAGGGLLHVDAVQGAGKLPLDMKALGADLMSLSAHKIGGPQGIGALIRRADLHFPNPLIRGGGQERGFRGGTENVPAIAGFGVAAAAARAELAQQIPRMTALRNQLEAGLKDITPDLVVFSVAAERLPNTTFFALPGARAETAIISLDLSGVAASSGSACSSGKVQGSPVLAAMGVPPEVAQGAIRLSLGRDTTKDDVGSVLNAWRKVALALSKGRAA